MVQIWAQVSEACETALAEMAFKKYKGRKGSISKIVEEAIMHYYENVFKGEKNDKEDNL